MIRIYYSKVLLSTFCGYILGSNVCKSVPFSCNVVYNLSVLYSITFYFNKIRLVANFRKFFENGKGKGIPGNIHQLLEKRMRPFRNLYRGYLPISVQQFHFLIMIHNYLTCARPLIRLFSNFVIYHTIMPQRLILGARFIPISLSIFLP